MVPLWHLRIFGVWSHQSTWGSHVFNSAPRETGNAAFDSGGAGWGACSAIREGGLGTSHTHARRAPLTQFLGRLPRALHTKVRPREKPARPDGEVALVCEVGWAGKPALSPEPRPARACLEASLPLHPYRRGLGRTDWSESRGGINTPHLFAFELAKRVDCVRRGAQPLDPPARPPPASGAYSW